MFNIENLTIEPRSGLSESNCSDRPGVDALLMSSFGWYSQSDVRVKISLSVILPFWSRVYISLGYLDIFLPWLHWCHLFWMTRSNRQLHLYDNRKRRMSEYLCGFFI